MTTTSYSAWDAAWAIATDAERKACEDAEAVVLTEDEPLARHFARQEAARAIRARLRQALVAGEVIAEGFADTGGPVERVPIPPPAWLTLGLDFDQGVAASEGRAFTGLRFRVPEQAESPAPVARPATLHDAHREYYQGFLATKGLDPNDPFADPPTLAEAEDALVGLMPRDTIRALQKEAWRERAAVKGRRAKGPKRG